ncbi:MAG TPA: glycerol-3-phosphate dehydrogenase C-terminal domain-containing protein, partial [Acidimicrobiales bacterium]|nr:glycerol-3-phosphate dehydrogenase C-terminal domain-containing protein [Acidimicrobiales bacterium]
RVLALADGRPGLLEPVIAGLPYTGAELLHAAREEMVCTLDDVLARRTRASIQRAKDTVDAAPAVAALIATELGWDAHRTAEEVAAFTESCQKELLTAGLELP